MKKKPAERREPPIRSEYDFSKGVRGKYAQRFRDGTNVVVHRRVYLKHQHPPKRMDSHD